MSGRPKLQFDIQLKAEENLLLILQMIHVVDRKGKSEPR